MANYWCTFRLAADKAYRERYEALLKAMFSLRGRSWTEPGHFWAFQADLPLEDAARILGKAIDPQRDLMVVGVIGGTGAVYLGQLQHPDAFMAMFPAARSLA